LLHNTLCPTSDGALEENIALLVQLAEKNGIAMSIRSDAIEAWKLMFRPEAMLVAAMTEVQMEARRAIGECKSNDKNLALRLTFDEYPIDRQTSDKYSVYHGFYGEITGHPLAFAFLPIGACRGQAWMMSHSIEVIALPDQLLRMVLRHIEESKDQAITIREIDREHDKDSDVRYDDGKWDRGDWRLSFLSQNFSSLL
jgi:hypothetical protein